MKRDSNNSIIFEIDPSLRIRTNPLAVVELGDNIFLLNNISALNYLSAFILSPSSTTALLNIYTELLNIYIIIYLLRK